MLSKTESRKPAYELMLRALASSAGKALTVSSALLGLIALHPNINWAELIIRLNITSDPSTLIAILSGVAGSISVEAMGTLLDRLSNLDAVSEEEQVEQIIQEVQTIVSKSGIDKLLDADSFFESFGHLQQGQASLREQNKEIHAMLKNVETIITEIRNESVNFGRNKLSTPFSIFSNQELLLQAVAKLFTFISEIHNVQILSHNKSSANNIIFTIKEPLGDFTYCACIVKNEPIVSEKSEGGHTVSKLIQQVGEMFSSTYVDNDGRRIGINRVYVISPFIISQNVIDSVERLIMQLSGQLTFIGGTNLFQLFRRYWPDFFVDETNAVEQHLGQLRHSISSENHLGNVAAMYNLGEVSDKEKKIFVPLKFSLDFDLFEYVQPLTTLLPSEEYLAQTETDEKGKVVKKKWKKSEVAQLIGGIKFLVRCIEHVYLWGFLGDSDKSVNEALTGLAVELADSWENAARKALGRKPDENILKLDAKAAFQLENYKELATLSQSLETKIISQLAYFNREINWSRKVSKGEIDKKDWTTGSDNILRFQRISSCLYDFPPHFFRIGKKRRIELDSDLLTNLRNPIHIVGPPGSGKSTFCRWNALHDAEQLVTSTSNIVPVYIPLHRINYDLSWSIEEHLASRAGHSALLNEGAKQLWDSGGGGLRLYLDGLDEISNEQMRESIIQTVQEFWRRREKVHIVLTSRDYIRSTKLAWLTRVSLAGLGEAEIELLIQQWLSDSTGLTDEFRSQLGCNPALYTLMQTPLLASLILLVFRRTRYLPTSRIKLYSVFMELLCGSWDRAKRLAKEQKYGSDVKLMIISELAAQNHFDGIRNFDLNQLRIVLKRIMHNIDMKGLQALLTELIEDGIIIGSGGVFEFTHFSFQEYLTAHHLAGDPNVTNIRKALQGFINQNDTWWYEPLRFYVGLVEPRNFARWVLRELDRVHAEPEQRNILFDFISESHPAYDIRKLKQDEANIFDLYGKY